MNTSTLSVSSRARRAALAFAILGLASGARAESALTEKKPEPFAFADFTWLTGKARTKEFPLDTKLFTGEFRFDVQHARSEPG